MDSEVIDAIASPFIPQAAKAPEFAPAYEVILDFVASLAGSVAWPLVVIGVAFLFRDQVIAMVNNVESVKVGGVEAKIRRNLRDAAEELKSAEPVTKVVARLNDDSFQRLFSMAEASPTGAIIEAWKPVEAIAREFVVRELPALRTRLERPDRLMSSGMLAKTLEDMGVLPASEINSFQKLRVIRNQAAHSSDSQITSDSAREYVRLADRMVDVFNQLMTAPEYQPDLFGSEQTPILQRGP